MPIWIVGIVAVVLFLMASYLWLLSRRLGIFFESAKGKNVEAFLLEQAAEFGKTKERVHALERTLAALEQKSHNAAQHIGVVRFNPFSDAGGDQSFAIAILDDHKNGFVISGLYAQGRPMVYAKPLEEGISRYTLTEEEKRAIEQATSAHG